MNRTYLLQKALLSGKSFSLLWLLCLTVVEKRRLFGLRKGPDKDVEASTGMSGRRACLIYIYIYTVVIQSQFRLHKKQVKVSLMLNEKCNQNSLYEKEATGNSL